MLDGSEDEEGKTQQSEDISLKLNEDVVLLLEKRLRFGESVEVEELEDWSRGIDLIPEAESSKKCESAEIDGEAGEPRHAALESAEEDDRNEETEDWQDAAESIEDGDVNERAAEKESGSVRQNSMRLNDNMGMEDTDGGQKQQDGEDIPDTRERSTKEGKGEGVKEEGLEDPGSRFQRVELDAMRENLRRNIHEVVHRTGSLYDLLSQLKRKGLAEAVLSTGRGLQRRNTNDKNRKESLYEALMRNLDWNGFYKLHWILDKINCQSVPPLIKTWLPLKDVIEVRRNLRSSFDHTKEYEALSQPRMLLLDNVFEDEARVWKGYDRDVANLSMLWNQLGFQVVLKTRLSSEELKEAVKEYREQAEADGCSCVAVFQVSLPGSREEDPIAVLEQFGPSTAPGLKNRPKIFFFQSGRQRVEELLKGRENTEEGGDSSLQSNLGELQETIILFPSKEGCHELRDNVAGSWFVLQMCQTFMHEACEYDLKTMIEHMEDDLSKNIHPIYGSQRFSWMDLNFSQMLYLYPGIERYQEKNT